MNNYLNAFLRSIIEAITEFLPVSSTGHLYLFTNYFPFRGLGDNAGNLDDLFDIFIQSGAILSVLVLYFAYLKNKVLLSFQYVKKETEDKSGLFFLLSVAVGSLPIMAIGFLVRKYLDVLKSQSYLLLLLGLAWLIGGIGILLAEKLFSKSTEEIENSAGPTLKQSAFIGLFQCIALIPGVSRSAATIISARSLGLSKKDSAEYSFFLAMPVLIAASLYKLYKYRDILHGENLLLLLFGTFFSFVFCLAIIKWFLAYIKKHDFSLFGYYRIILGGIVITLYLLKS
ncbi:MAG: undecaprenyl-diphosphate phosphatase [Leptospiraceae bacterium]|nr:undecaprenyl-diphosphate phosphatase [Leptospiraceae bacterium]MCP5503015.1 undecaprenyl-diphosphate phosphatase [Leptospiraceae bacterium]